MRSTKLNLHILGHQIDSFIRRNRYLLWPGKWTEYRTWLQEQSPEFDPDSPTVVFDFADSRIDGPQGRRFYCLFIFFIRTGYFPIIIANYRFLATRNEGFKHFMLAQAFAVLSHTTKIEKADVLVTDRFVSKSVQNRFKKILKVDYKTDYLSDREGFPFPFPMFPKVYATGQDLQLAQLRATEKRWSVFFGGDAEDRKYSKNTIRDIYKTLPRAEVLNTLKSQLPSALCYQPESENELERLSGQKVKGVVLVNTRSCSIAPQNWLKTVAGSRFFIACPGVRYPMSHNAIEALAVGCIPIIQYQELFFPALEHDVNCLTYSSSQSLVEAVTTAINMPDHEVQRLAAGAIDYYQTYLEPNAVIARMLTADDKQQKVRLLPFLKRGGGFA